MHSHCTKGMHQHLDQQGDSLKNITIVLFLNLGFAVFELMGGWYFDSFAVLADALHDFGDAITLLFALLLERLARVSANQRYSYGFRRLSLLSAAMTGLILVMGSVFIGYMSVQRFFEPSEPQSVGMMGMAILGIGVNAYAAMRLVRGKTMNERVLSWHLWEDVAGWVIVFLAGAALYAGGPTWIDPAISLVFCGVILWGVFRALRDTLALFLQAVPKTVDLDRMRSKWQSIEGIKQIKDVRCWSLDGQQHVMTVHAALGPDVNAEQQQNIRQQMRMEAEGFGVVHITIELEQ